jgi:hypothetical protein
MTDHLGDEAFEGLVVAGCLDRRGVRRVWPCCSDPYPLHTRELVRHDLGRAVERLVHRERDGSAERRKEKVRRISFLTKKFAVVVPD